MFANPLVDSYAIYRSRVFTAILALERGDTVRALEDLRFADQAGELPCPPASEEVPVDYGDPFAEVLPPASLMDAEIGQWLEEAPDAEEDEERELSHAEQARLVEDQEYRWEGR